MRLEFWLPSSQGRSKLRTYEEVKSDNADLQALLNDAAVQLYQSEARPQATLEKKGKGKA